MRRLKRAQPCRWGLQRAGNDVPKVRSWGVCALVSWRTEELWADQEHSWQSLQEEEGDEEDAAAEAAAEEQRQAEMDEAADDDDKNALHPQDIDAYWLQRRVAGAFTDIDADRSQKLAEEVLSALAVST